MRMITESKIDLTELGHATNYIDDTIRFVNPNSPTGYTEVTLPFKTMSRFLDIFRPTVR